MRQALSLKTKLGWIFCFGIGLFLGCAPAPEERKPSTIENKIPATNANEKVFPNGLRYVEMKIGDGLELKPQGRALVHYSGYLSDGSPFDSSYDRKKPYEVSLKGGVIQGWIEGLPGMKVGGQRKLIIPPALGYGSSARPKIPANSTLIFEIKLLQILE